MIKITNKIWIILAVLTVIMICFMAGVATADDPEGSGKGKHGRGGPPDCELDTMEDFRGKGNVEGEKLLPDELPAELGIIQLTGVN